MHGAKREKAVRLAIAGMGNCASSLIEGISYYAQHPEDRRGLLFPTLGGYAVADIEVVAAFDISRDKVGRPVDQAILQRPNNFVRIPGISAIENPTGVQRGPSL